MLALATNKRNFSFLILCTISLHCIPQPSCETAPEIINTLYQMMFDIHTLFTANQIPYWALAGTLLGAVRHKGIIPWDDDIDIAVPAQHKHTLEALQPLLQKAGYRLHHTNRQANIMHIDRQMAQSSTHATKVNYPFIEIFLVHQQDDKILCYDLPFSPYQRKRNGLAMYLTTEEAYPLKLYPFGAFHIFGPHNPLPILYAEYGDNVLQNAFYCGKHKFERTPKKLSWELDEDAFTPAQPTTIVKNAIPKSLADHGLWDDEIAYLSSLITSRSHVFDWSPGTWKTDIAHHARCYDVVTNNPIAQDSSNNQTHVMYRPCHNAKTSHAYITAVNHYKKQYDIILIRGNHKAACAQQARTSLRPDGLMIIDHFNALSTEDQEKVMTNMTIFQQLHSLMILSHSN